MANARTGTSRHSGVGHESIDGTLSGPLLQFDLGSELDLLHRDESWLHPTGRSSKTLAKYPDLRIVLIAMKAKAIGRPSAISTRKAPKIMPSSQYHSNALRPQWLGSAPKSRRFV